MLTINGLKVNIGDKQILNGVNLTVGDNKIQALMGQNGSGKSTLAQTLMGNPQYSVIAGEAVFDGVSLLDLPVEQRATKGIFLSFQYPSEVTGVSVSSFLRLIYNKSHEKHLSPVKFRECLKEKMDTLGVNPDFATRYINEGFSGGEKKRMEMLQMLIVEPKLIILDEVDSGLDVDAIKIVAKAVNSLKEKNKSSVLIITHYARILKYLVPDVVHVMRSGEIAQEGTAQLAHELEEKGFLGI